MQPKINLSFLIIVIISVLSCLSAVALGAESIRVAVADDEKEVVLFSKAGLIIEGAPAGRVEKRLTFSAAANAFRRPMRVTAADGEIRVNGKGYRGLMEVRKKSNGLLLVVNELYIEDYLRGVIAAEVPPDWAVEALKAQAVASRTYALYRKKTSGRRPYHILATVNGQVYAGRSGEHKNALRAVRDTEGLVVVYRGEVIPAFYHSSCGGHTENALELWGLDEPYLRGVDCECQAISKYGAWEKRLAVSRVAALLARRGYRLRDISDMVIESITPAGRVRSVSIRSGGAAAVVPAETLRAAMGYSFIPSVFFELSVDGGEAVFSGRGMGHGVGLCQWGAEEMAEKGQDYASILRWYYPGTSLARIDEL